MATRTQRRSRRTVIEARPAPAIPATVPRRWVKFVVGLFLLPLAWVMTRTFFEAFARSAVHEALWATDTFWFFSLGVLIWLVAFAMLPRPLWIYVFGHELTHALGVWISGGKVTEFRVSESGGHIQSDRINTWIALAPYFFPIYSAGVIALYGLGGLLWDMSPFRPTLFMMIGATWAFHLTFTAWMIPKGQPDLTYGGTFFSLILIYIFNLGVLSIFLIAASPRVTCLSFASELLRGAMGLNDFLASAIGRITR